MTYDYFIISILGDKWLSHRKLLTPAFHFSILNNFCEVFNSNVKVYMKELHASRLVEKADNICPFTRMLTLNVICGMKPLFSNL